MSTLWPARNCASFSYISNPPDAGYIQQIERRIAILGSTGSIGGNALAIAAASPSLRIEALAAGRNIELLAQQAISFRPKYLAVLTQELGQSLANLLPAAYDPEIGCGSEAYARLAALPSADCVLCAQSGAAGLTGALAAALAGKVIALANKESLVIAGSLLRKICADTGAVILPVDSEHYAIFQCLAGAPCKEIKRLILTASGGPFYGKAASEIAHAGPDAALRHPNWSMGVKISIDSATLMNKGLEFIEAMHLFGVSADKIRIAIHPQSIVHSLVQFSDNSILGQFACPDMRLPIAACLHWPWRGEAFVKELDLLNMPPLTFSAPDMEAFPCLGYAIRAASYEPSASWRELGVNPACMALNFANERAVEAYLAGKLDFGGIARVIAAALDKLPMDSMTAPQWPGVADPVVCAVEMAGEIEKFALKLNGEAINN